MRKKDQIIKEAFEVYQSAGWGIMQMDKKEEGK